MKAAIPGVARSVDLVRPRPDSSLMGAYLVCPDDGRFHFEGRVAEAACPECGRHPRAVALQQRAEEVESRKPCPECDGAYSDELLTLVHRGWCPLFFGPPTERDVYRAGAVWSGGFESSRRKH